MAHSQRSLSLTDLYRDRMVLLVDLTQRNAHVRWPSIEALDDTLWVAETSRSVGAAQVAALRLTAGYLASFLSTELGRRVGVSQPDRGYVGLARDGRPLTEALVSSLIGVKRALKDGKTPDEALTYGLRRALRAVELDTMHAARASLLDSIDSDERFDGWQRVTKGTCGACMALSGVGGPQFQVHPSCSCVAQPRVSGVRDRFPVPTGAALFASKSREEQDAALGPEAAERVRSDGADLGDLVDHSHLDSAADDFLTQRPVAAQ